MAKTAKKHVPGPLTLEDWPLEKIIPYEKNARIIPESAIDKVAASLKEYGWQQPIVVDPKGVIVVGHTRRLAALKLGWKTAPVTVARGLSASQIRAYRLMDNRSHEEATWNDKLLAVELGDLKSLDFDLKLTGFEPLQIDGLFAKAEAVTEGLTDPDEVPAVPEEPVTKPGDLWILGRHRLLCGDSTSSDAVDRLMDEVKPEACITDPPYNVGLSYGEKVNDNKTDTEYADFNRAWFHIATALVRSCIALTPGITNVPMWLADIERTHRIIAWIKENQCSRNYIGATSGFNIWEPVLIYGKAKKCVSRDSFSIPIHIQQEAAGHPCPKSIKAWTWIIETLTDEGDVLFEPFSGSGTTIMAAEKTSRTVYALELEPKYCDLAIKRWENFTGKKAVLA